MASPLRTAARLRCLFLLASLPALAQVPPQILKPLGDKIIQKILKPKMKVESFTVGGFTVKDVDPTDDATAEHFEGTGMIQLPAPAEPVKITFKNLVLKGGAAEGTVEAGFHANHHSDHQGWNYLLKKAVISEKGAHLEGTATLAGIKLNIGTLAFTPAGLQGTLTPGDLYLSEGDFTAILQKAEVVFGSGNPQLKGALRVEIASPVRSAITGETVRLESGSIALDSALLTSTGNGIVVDALATNLPVQHKGSNWWMNKVTFRFERGNPVLSTPLRLQFALQVFCRFDATEQPYVTESAPCNIYGRIPHPGSHGLIQAARDRDGEEVANSAKDLVMGFKGFSGSFPLPPATLYPSGLTAYKLVVDGGSIQITNSLAVPDQSSLSGNLYFGPGYPYQISFNKAKASLMDGLFVDTAKLETNVSLGNYQLNTLWSDIICDFSPTLSVEGMAPEWKGVYLPKFLFFFPLDLYTPAPDGSRSPAWAVGEKGWFEANGRFTANIGVSFTEPLMLYIAPVTLNPFDMEFADGVLLKGPTVTGNVHVDAPPILENFDGDLTFKLTHNGIEQVEVKPNQVLKSDLIGVDIVLESAVLNVDNWDLTGRFDLHVVGAALPSFPFEHMTLQATGGGINGDNSPLKLGMSGCRWDAFQDNPNVNLWGFNFGLSERGFGTLEDGRFFVGFGGQMEVNPMLPGMYNRVLLTTQPNQDPTKKPKGTVELEQGFELHQNMAGLGQVDGSIGFHVEVAGEQVSKAYFLGNGDLHLNLADAPLHAEAGLLFGRAFQGNSSFPYFYVLGELASDTLAVPIAPDVEIYGFLGGLAQNYQPDNIRNMKNITGTPNPDLGYAVIAGVDVGTSDHYTFHGDLDLYVAQNFTTKLHGDGWLFCERTDKPDDSHVWTDIKFSRKPNVLDATFGANIAQAGGSLRYIGEVQLYVSSDKQFLHIGTKQAPVQAVLDSIGKGTGYFTVDLGPQSSVFTAGIGFSLDSGRRDFGPFYGRAWFNANGDLVIEIPKSGPTKLRGTIAANGGAEFGMSFSTFWDDYDITIFSGSLGANLAFQVPGSPKFSGVVTIHYSVLGGLFDGDASAHIDF
jgi:hypothetical protein